MIEAGIPRPRTCGSLRIDILQIIQHGLHRCVEAVQVKSEKADLWRFRRKIVIVSSQPPDEVQHIGVPPHPLWKSLETRQRLVCAPVGCVAANVAVDAVCVREVRLDSHGRKALFPYQSFGYLSPLPVKLMGSVRGFTQEHKTRIANEIDQSVIVARLARPNPMGLRCDTARNILRRSACFDFHSSTS